MDKVFAQKPELEGERKQVTVLFCDIVESTALAARLGPETMHTLLDQFFRTALEEVHGCEGTINQFLGDGFMAIFGAPVAHEDHARRAATAALNILRRCFAPVANPTDAQFPMRFGLNTGPVVVGRIGDDLRMDYTAIGDTVNMAARMQQHASPGEILLTTETRDVLSAYFECEAAGARHVKGRKHSVAVHVLRRPRQSLENTIGGRSQNTASPFVGRSAELGVLETQLRALARGNGSLIMVTGEAGLGKSRLLAESRRRFATNLQWLEGAAMSFGGAAYLPFATALRPLLGVDDLSGTEDAWRRLNTMLHGLLGPEVGELLPFAGMLLRLEMPQAANILVSKLDPLDVRGQVFKVARRLLIRASSIQPVFLHLEDWHWADQASSGLLFHLLPLVESHPVTICVNGRLGQDQLAQFKNAVSRFPGIDPVFVELTPLAESDSSSLLTSLGSRIKIAANSRREILARAEGNPLFLEEVAYSLHGIQTSGVTRDGVTTTHLERAITELPRSIDAIISARIDRLQRDAKHVLRIAAVVGRNFYRRVLQIIKEDDVDLDANLVRLEEGDFIRHRGEHATDEYLFKHVLVREASYRGILEGRRRQLHLRVAEAIEALFADRRNEYAGLLAYHYASANIQAKAQQYVMIAADHAARMSNDAEALELYSQAARSYSESFGENQLTSVRAALEQKIGEAQFRLGDHERAIEHLKRALALLGEAYPDSRALAAIRATGFVFRHLIRSVLWTNLPPRASLSEDDKTRFGAFVTLGWLHLQSDQVQFFYNLVAALHWAEQQRFAPAMIQTWTGLGLIFDVIGMPRISAIYHRRSSQLAESVGEDVGRGTAVQGDAYHHYILGDISLAFEKFSRAHVLFRSAGKIREQAIALASVSVVAQLAGRLGESAAAVAQLAELAHDSGDDVARLYYLERQASCWMLDGKLEQAVGYLQEAVAGLRLVPDIQVECWALGRLALAALWSGDFDLARSALTDGRRLMKSALIQPDNSSEVLLTTSWLALEEALQSVPSSPARSLRSLRRAASKLRAQGRYFRCMKPMVDCVTGAVEWLSGRPTRALDRWDAASRAASQQRALLYVAIIDEVRGRFARDAALLTRAARQYEAFGSVFCAARAHRLVGDCLEVSDPDLAISHYFQARALHERMTAAYEAQRLHEAIARIERSRAAGFTSIVGGG